MAFLGSSAQPYKDILICQVETPAASRPWARAAGTGPRPERSGPGTLTKSGGGSKWDAAREPPRGRPAAAAKRHANAQAALAGRCPRRWQVPGCLAVADRARRFPAFIRALLVARHDRAAARAGAVHPIPPRDGRAPRRRGCFGAKG